MNRLIKITLALIIFFTAFRALAAEVTDPLPSWREGAAKRNIIEFVQAVTDKSNSHFVPPEDRIATIDNDGTLWVEQPIYTQAIFMLNRYDTLLKKHKNWPKITAKKLTRKDLEFMFTTTSAGMSIAEYKTTVKEWLQHARHSRFKRLYTELIYQPMLEVINYLHDNDFDVYIVSGGGQEFVRAFSQSAYDISTNHVIGSTIKTQYQYNHNKPKLIKMSQPLFISDKAGKPEAINLFIGKKPIIAIGNSDGDREMLEWTQSNPSKHLMVLVHHDDAEREYAYGPGSKVGTFSDSLMKEAKAQHWQVISMKDDWKVIFPFELNHDLN